MWNAISLVQDLNSCRRVHSPTTITTGTSYTWLMIIFVIVRHQKLIIYFQIWLEIDIILKREFIKFNALIKNLPLICWFFWFFQRVAEYTIKTNWVLGNKSYSNTIIMRILGIFFTMIFPKSCWVHHKNKVIVIAHLEFELASFEAAVQYFNHYVTETPHCILIQNLRISQSKRHFLLDATYLVFVL